MKILVFDQILLFTHQPLEDVLTACSCVFLACQNLGLDEEVHFFKRIYCMHALYKAKTKYIQMYWNA